MITPGAKVLQDKSKLKIDIKKDLWAFLLGAVGMAMVVVLVATGAYWWVYKDRILPGVNVAGVDVAGMRVLEAVSLVEEIEANYIEHEKLSVVVESADSEGKVLVNEYQIGLSDLGVEYDARETVLAAFGVGRGGSFGKRISDQWRALSSEVEVEHKYSMNRQDLSEFVALIKSEVDKPGVPASVTIDDSDEIEVVRGEAGYELNRESLEAEVEGRLAKMASPLVEVAPEMVGVVIDEEQAEMVKARAESVREQELVVVGLEEQGVAGEWTLNGDELVYFIDPQGGFIEEKVAEFVKGVAESVNREPQNALFKFENGRVTEFAPGLDGVLVDEEVVVNKIVRELEGMEGGSSRQKLTQLGGQASAEEEDEEGEEEEREYRVELVARITPPEVNTPEVNDLGIKELLGRGESTYYHSIPGRIHNVALTASRLNGVLVPPGATFSFNQTVGEISAATGYQSAYVIKDGRTVLGDGGGVCQDSTTLFRAILDAGLPVVQRKAHSYRVGYYEQNSEPGFDATVYAPSVDLKFENDTPGHLLIQAKADTSNLSLVIEIYGTSDGREAEISNYQKWGAVPAPPPLYQDDPTLPAGVVKQVDWAAPGLKTQFDYTVKRGGEIIHEKTFYSNFRPWRAVYLRGVGG